MSRFAAGPVHRFVQIAWMLSAFAVATPEASAEELSPPNPYSFLPKADKAAHFGVSTIGVASTLKLAQFFSKDHHAGVVSRLAVSAFWLSIGAVKEVHDMHVKKSGFDWGDMSADFGGVLYGQILAIEF